MLESDTYSQAYGTEHDFEFVADRSQGDSSSRLYEDSDLSKQSGFRRNDIGRAESSKSQSTAEILSVIEQGTASFRRFDSNQDGFLSYLEIDQAILNPTLTDSHLEFVLLLKSVDNKLQLVARDSHIDGSEGISRADLKLLQTVIRTGETKEVNSTAEQLVIDDSQRCHRNVQTALRNIAAELYENQQSPLSSIRPEAIKQGMVGDCFFLSSIGSTANFNPESILKMIEDNHNGTYTVTFPGAADRPITVSAPTRAEQAFFTKGSPDGFWPLVLEKAYGELVQKTNNRDYILDAESVSLGGQPEKVLKLLTGSEVESYQTEITPQNEIESLLVEATRERRPLVAGTDKGPIVEQNGLVGQHAYAILAFDPQTKTVTLRNPYGKLESTRNDSGVELKGHSFQMPLDEFCRCFCTLTVVQPADPARRRPARQQLG